MPILRDLIVDHWELPADWLAWQQGMRVTRLLADPADDKARRRLRVWRARLRERAEAGDGSAQRFLAANPYWR